MDKILENDEILIYSTPQLDIINDSIVDNTLKKLDEYRKIFKREKLKKLKVTLYDDVETFREDYRRITNLEPPSYSRGWIHYKPGNIYICINLEALMKFKDDPLFWDNKVSCVAHEIFHYYYCIYYYGKNRITWFDEGMAQFLSGETVSYHDREWYELFKCFVDTYKVIDNLNERKNGNSNVPDSLIFKRENVFEGYQASLLAIKFLFDTKGEEKVFDIMFDNGKILEEGKDILDRMIIHYNKVFSDRLQIKRS